MDDGAVAIRRGPSAGRKKPITVEAIVETALAIVEREGYDALTMRRVAAALETGPASLYAHVVNKQDLDDLLIGRLCAEITLPPTDPDSWRRQVHEVCAQLRDRYLAYPGISRAALAMVPTDRETMRVSEGILGILLAGGVPPQAAAWTADALLLYVAGYCLELSVARVLDRDELKRRLTALPVQTFPNTVRYADVLTAGQGHDRFDFTIDLMISGLAAR
jgi:AcrR family transcriptional regulator